jgi:hypothetical protein
MDMNKAAEICRKTRGGKTGKGFMHDGNRTNLFLGKLVGPFEVVDLYLAGIGGGTEILRFRIPRIDSGKKLINLFLR